MSVLKFDNQTVKVVTAFMKDFIACTFMLFEMKVQELLYSVKWCLRKEAAIY